MFAKFIRTFLVIVVVVAALGYAAYKYYINMGTPEYSGIVETGDSVPSADVKVYRDEYGVPHIVGKTEADVYFALGYVHAQERLFQMMLFRLYSQGRLSEFAGDVPMDRDSTGHSSILAQDKFYRVVGFKEFGEKQAEAVSPESRALADAYTAGVNTYIETADRLPPEFSLVGTPEPWQSTDSLIMGRLIAWFLSHNWKMELQRLLAIKELGLERGWALFPRYPGDGPFIIDPKIKKYDPRGKSFEKHPLPLPPEFLDGPLATALLDIDVNAHHALPGLVPPPPSAAGYGSNSWVVDGSRTSSGAPILCNDPHLVHYFPSIFYQAHLVSEDGLDVIGVTFPGMPFITLGHNRHIAWGATTTRADTQDLFVEKVNPDNPDEYMLDGEWKRFAKREEVFRVKTSGGMEEMKMTVRTTEHGPVINDVVPELAENAPPISLAWTGHIASDDATGFFEIARATGAAGAKAAFAQIGSPVQNWVYADTGGNIGYFANGWFPLRPTGDGTLPVPGWTGEHEWSGFVPVDELPQLDNPSNGLIITANNAVLPEDDYPHTVSYNYFTYRARRINEMLGPQTGLTTRQMKRYQHDRYAKQAERLAPLFVAAFDKAGDKQNRLAAEAAEILRDWDYNTSSESLAPTIFYNTYRELLFLCFSDEMPEYLVKLAVLGDAMEAPRDLAFEQGDFAFFDIAGTPQVEGRDEIFALALENAARSIAYKHGDDTTQWNWGKYHKLMFIHPLAAVKPLDKVFPHRIIESDGGRGTVFESFFSLINDNFTVTAGPCFRQIIDMSDIAGAEMIIDTGQSGHPRSKHRFDQNDKWYNGGYIPMHFDIAALKENNEGVLTLSPASGNEGNKKN